MGKLHLLTVHSFEDAFKDEGELIAPYLYSIAHNGLLAATGEDCLTCGYFGAEILSTRRLIRSRDGVGVVLLYRSAFQYIDVDRSVTVHGPDGSNEGVGRPAK
jgi:hypothetical protein